jgi:hypothetical protein
MSVLKIAAGVFLGLMLTWAVMTLSTMFFFAGLSTTLAQALKEMNASMFTQANAKGGQWQSLPTMPTDIMKEKEEQQRRLEAQQAEVARQKAEAEAIRKAEWKQFYKPAPECNRQDATWDEITQCSNDAIRQRKTFEASTKSQPNSHEQPPIATASNR